MLTLDDNNVSDHERIVYSFTTEYADLYYLGVYIRTPAVIIAPPPPPPPCPKKKEKGKTAKGANNGIYSSDS